jgi:ferredoxin
LFLEKLTADFDVYTPVKINQHIDYKIYNRNNGSILYNQALPVTPLKFFFLPVRENVVISNVIHNKKLIIGVPSCDLKGLELLDEIYLDDKFPDPTYKENRLNTILIGTDCHEIRENCHCTTYGVDPYPTANADATLVHLNGNLLITVKTSKGEELIRQCSMHVPVTRPQPEMLEMAETRRSATRAMLKQQNQYLPDYSATGDLIRDAGPEIWEKYAQTCVSCGACASICPTCTCFLLIDRPDFEKVRQLDACQYPGFEKIAAGGDPLHRKPDRFKNRYLCKYVWKPERFSATACTGCGRCIDCCIGNINKNKIFVEMLENK